MYPVRVLRLRAGRGMLVNCAMTKFGYLCRDQTLPNLVMIQMYLNLEIESFVMVMSNRLFIGVMLCWTTHESYQNHPEKMSLLGGELEYRAFLGHLSCI